MSPLKSKAQWKKFRAMLARGEITQKQWDKWSRGVSFKSLPTRVGKKQARKTKKGRSKKTARKRQGRKR